MKTDTGKVKGDGVISEVNETLTHTDTRAVGTEDTRTTKGGQNDGALERITLYPRAMKNQITVQPLAKLGKQGRKP